MARFQTKNRNLGKLCRIWQWKVLVYFMDIWSLLWPFDVFYGHLVNFMSIWYIFFTFWYVVPRKIWQPCCSDQPVCTLLAEPSLHPRGAAANKVKP
jgi:hypothetical protein